MIDSRLTRRIDTVTVRPGTPTQFPSGRPARARRSFRPGVLGMVVAAGVLVASCGDPGQVKVTNAVPAHQTLAPVVAQMATYQAGFEAAVATCLEGEGFRFFPKPQEWHEADLTRYLAVPILALSVEEASASGYSSLSAPSDPGRAEELAYFDSMDEVEAKALYEAHFGSERIQVDSVGGFEVDLGVGGCAGQAATAVYGGAQAWARAVGALEDIKMATVRPMDEALASKEVERALDAWSQCMASAGRDVATPSDARTAALETRDHGQTEPSAEEIAIAVDDATCQAETDLPAIFTDQVVTHQQPAISDIERVFLAWDELVDEITAATA